MITYAIISTLVLLALAAGISVIAIRRLGDAPGHVRHSRRPKGTEPFHRPVLASHCEQVSCSHCSGGTQWLHPDHGWGKIPRPLLFRRRGADGDFECGEPIHANLRSCPYCTGFGAVNRVID